MKAFMKLIVYAPPSNRPPIARMWRRGEASARRHPLDDPVVWWWLSLSTVVRPNQGEDSPLQVLQTQRRSEASAQAQASPHRKDSRPPVTVAGRRSSLLAGDNPARGSPGGLGGPGPAGHSLRFDLFGDSARSRRRRPACDRRRPSRRPQVEPLPGGLNPARGSPGLGSGAFGVRGLPGVRSPPPAPPARPGGGASSGPSPEGGEALVSVWGGTPQTRPRRRRRRARGRPRLRPLHRFQALPHVPADHEPRVDLGVGALVLLAPLLLSCPLQPLSSQGGRRP